MLVIALMSMTLLTALTMTVLLTTMTETAISASYRKSTETFYAAEAAVQYVMRDIGAVSDWSAMLTERATSAFVDGPPSGTRTVGDTTLDLTLVTADVNAFAGTADGPDGAAWELYAFGRFEDMLGSRMIRLPMYVVVWVADRSGEVDEDVSDSPGRDVLAILGQAYGTGGSRRTVEVTVARVRTSTEEGPAPMEVPMEVLAWREPR